MTFEDLVDKIERIVEIGPSGTRDEGYMLALGSAIGEYIDRRLAGAAASGDDLSPTLAASLDEATSRRIATLIAERDQARRELANAEALLAQIRVGFARYALNIETLIARGLSVPPKVPA